MSTLREPLDTAGRVEIAMHVLEVPRPGRERGGPVGPDFTPCAAFGTRDDRCIVGAIELEHILNDVFRHRVTYHMISGADGGAG